MTTTSIDVDQYMRLPRDTRDEADAWLIASGVQPDDVDALRCTDGQYAARYVYGDFTSRPPRRMWRNFTAAYPCPIEFPTEEA